MFTHALLRRPASNVAEGLTTLDEGRPDAGLTLAQFEAYAAALRDAGLETTILEPLDAFPDAHFVEDVAVITPGATVLTHPGADARRGEVEAIAAHLRADARIEAPGTLDGGDVLVVGDRVFVGLSTRTNEHGARQLAALVEAQGMECEFVPVTGGLHLKSSVNAVADDTLLLTRAFAEHPAFASLERIVVPDGEDYAANVLRVNDRVLVPAGYPGTLRALRVLGVEVVELDTSEFRKMDGGLTCLSLRFAEG